MPLPWLHSGRNMQSGFEPVRVADPVNRAITIKQLRQLRLYIQRLCKARLLQHTSDSPFGFYKAGGQIHWSEINLYDITDEILKKLIPFLLRQQPDQPSDDSCSWMELVASGPKTPKILLSHWWGGRFRDLMCMIDMLVDAKSLSVSTPIWICTFANNQIRGEDFGERVAGFPFMGAIDAAELTVLVVDRNAGSLGRTWCGLEVHGDGRQREGRRGVHAHRPRRRRPSLVWAAHRGHQAVGHTRDPGVGHLLLEAHLQFHSGGR